MSNIFSDVKIFPIQGNAKILARGEVVVHKTVKVKFTVLNGSNGRFVSLPSEKGAKPDENGKDKYWPLVSMVNRELQDELNKVVLAALDGNKEESAPAGKPASKKPVGDGIPF
jgi:DNA-binding cell septation regulator SpoVG